MKNSKFNLLTALMLGGSFVAYSIGSSFGTGQDTLQWFAAHGSMGIPGYILNAAMICGFVMMVLFDCRKYHLTDSRAVFYHYCGKYLGFCFHWYAILLICGLTILMISGSGATIAEYYGINTFAGRVIMALLVLVTIIFGLQKTISAIACIGPAILIIVLFVAVLGILNPEVSLAEGSALMQQNDDVIQAGSNWIHACLLYFTYCLILQIPYLSGLAFSTHGSTREILIGFAIGGAGMGLAGAAVVFSFLVNVDAVTSAQVPLLTLGMRFSPIIGAVFGLILLGAIYTTAAPMAWGTVTAFFKEDSPLYRPAVAVFCIATIFLSGAAPFARLANWLSTVSGWIGILFLFPFFYTKFIRRPPVPEANAGSDSETL